MDAILPIMMFLVGFAAGGGIIWFLARRRVDDAREQERNIALASVRVAEERTTAKEGRIAELQAAMLQGDQRLQRRDEENSQLRQQHAVLRTSLEKEHEKIEEKIKLLADAEKQLKDAFSALAERALEKNNEKFDQLSKPVKTILGEINTKIAVVNESAAKVGVEASKLVKALQKPEVRGQWGEMHLARVLEVAGMTEGRDFHKQQVLNDGDAQLRPDVVVHLPGGKHLAIDAKAPIRAFLEAAEAVDEETRHIKAKEFSGHVRERIRQLSSKTYHQSLDSSPEFVVLYLPTEAVYCEALKLDHELLENAFRQRVVLAGPCNLISLLLAVAHGWKQEALTEHAKDICDLGKELYKRLTVFCTHIASVGDGLNKSVKAYNNAVGSFESRVMPKARKFEQLFVGAVDAQIDELVPVETQVRSLDCDELTL
ncbi:MAG: DNA recombination protein RmuC, partial [Pirellulales bacterium]